MGHWVQRFLPIAMLWLGMFDPLAPDVAPDVDTDVDDVAVGLTLATT
jgi:hypothetical protein